ncbi:MAG: hypothetical protein SPI15_13385 [Candidatus Faecousia sp.]|nr:hypothetical protein [Candidatus Faecousia sp.]
MEIYTVSLFGHRRLDSPIQIEKQLEKLILELLSSKPYVEFLVGRDGDFDLLAASVIHRCRRIFRADNSSLVWVMPYLTAEYRDRKKLSGNITTRLRFVRKPPGNILRRRSRSETAA